MKKIYYLLVLLVIVGASCSDKRKKNEVKSISHRESTNLLHKAACLMPYLIFIMALWTVSATWKPIFGQQKFCQVVEF
ncbi:hypothetical protein SAMN05216518_10899 [Bacteroidales bacterium KHT7]|nr:hypothetical protein SAMN05216518_10899 [Bacteroidales bacterium KHT7]